MENKDEWPICPEWKCKICEIDHGAIITVSGNAGGHFSDPVCVQCVTEHKNDLVNFLRPRPSTYLKRRIRSDGNRSDGNRSHPCGGFIFGILIMIINLILWQL